MLFCKNNTLWVCNTLGISQKSPKNFFWARGLKFGLWVGLHVLNVSVKFQTSSSKKRFLGIFHQCQWYACLEVKLGVGGTRAFLPNQTSTIFLVFSTCHKRFPTLFLAFHQFFRVCSDFWVAKLDFRQFLWLQTLENLQNSKNKLGIVWWHTWDSKKIVLNWLWRYDPKTVLYPLPLVK